MLSTFVGEYVKLGAVPKAIVDDAVQSWTRGN